MVLEEADLFEKAKLTHEIACAWKEGAIHTICAPKAGKNERNDYVSAKVPDAPCRPPEAGSSPPPVYVSSSSSKKKYLTTVHGIAHAESYAIDLFWDLIARFSWDVSSTGVYAMDEVNQRKFFDEFVEVCQQEAQHFVSWAEHLGCKLGCDFGSLPAHKGLWRAASETSGDLLERLAVVGLVHEARGLDTYAATKQVRARIHLYSCAHTPRVVSDSFNNPRPRTNRCCTCKGFR